jgi:hypothetical protein
MVNGGGYVFGYGRKPEYFRWTTTMERQLYAASPEPPAVPENFVKKPGAAEGKKGAVPSQFAQFGKAPALDPTSKPVTVEAWMTATNPNGVIVARGGPQDGFALTLETGKPTFLVRSSGQLMSIAGPKRIVGGWHHLVGVLTTDRQMRLYVDGQLAAEGTAPGLLTKDPAQPLDIGDDTGSAVGEYTLPNQFVGIIDEVRLYFAEVNADTVQARFQDAAEMHPEPALVVSFDDNTARDMSLNRNNGTLNGGQPVEGRFGQAIKFSGRKNGGAKQANPAAANTPNSLIEPKWNVDVPVYVRAMVLSGYHLFIAGPPDLIDEEATFRQLAEKDQAVDQLLATQDAAIQGQQGGQLVTVNSETGEILHTLQLQGLPSWDGLAAARGQLFLTTLDGHVLCLGAQ